MASRETELPGVGTKHSIDLVSGDARGPYRWARSEPERLFIAAANLESRERLRDHFTRARRVASLA